MSELVREGSALPALEEQQRSAGLRKARFYAVPLAALAITIPLLFLGYFIATFWLYVITVALAWVVIGNGVNVIVGTSGTPALHSAATMGIAAYAVAILMREGLSYWLALPLAVFVATAVATLLLLPTARLEGFYLAIASFIAVLLVQEVLNQWDGLTRGPYGMPIGGPEYNGLTGAQSLYPVALVAALGAMLFSWWMTWSRTGLRMRAARDSRSASRTIGVSPVMCRVQALLMGNVVVALGGALLGSASRYLEPTQFGLQMVFSTILIVWVGGLDRLGAPIVGAILISVLPNLSSGLQQYSTAITYSLLLAVLLLRPQGLITLIPGLSKSAVLK